jgi:hypothetical protein
MEKSDNNIDTANKLGNLFNSWGKILIGVGLAVISCANAYYEIYENKEDTANEKRERIANEKIIEDRADKRYARAMETATELKDFIKFQQSEIIELREKQAYIEGYIKGKEFNEKK